MSGWVRIVGLGPGCDGMITPEAQAIMAQATDIVGYGPYVDRIPDSPGQRKHASDNRVERERADHALELARGGGQVAVVSSGDPGVFAMASAVFEAVEADPAALDLDIAVIPGITAMLAAAARVGAPLGHDFCALNLSDNLKPWSLVERRLRLAAEADLAMAFYNPRSRARPDGFARALAILSEVCADDRLVIFARAVTTPEEEIRVVPLSQARPEMADMRTMVLVGASTTRQVGRFVYTPRSVP